MLNVLFCLLGSFVILLASEHFYDRKVFKPEDRRKFVHILTGSFVATWPWIISWRSIQIIGLMMLLGVAINRYHTFFRFSKEVRRISVGDYTFALAIILSATMTHNKLFFAVAILNMALADGLAAIIGKRFGKNWRYKIFNQEKTLIGTMSFWLVSLIILGAVVPFAYNYIPYSTYFWLLLLLPPTLALIENMGVWGLDNLLTPAVVILALQLASQTA